MKFTLKRSLALWRRRLKFRRERLDVAREAGDRDRVRKWTRLVEEAESSVDLRKRQLHEKRPLRVRAIEVARKNADVREQGGNNVGKAVEKIIRTAGGTPGEPWCGDFVAYCYLVAGIAPSKVTRAWAYVPTLEKLLTRVWRPKQGHIAIYNWDGGVPDHNGLFDEWIDKRAGLFYAWEGNTRKNTKTSDAGGGEGVERRQRHISEVQSFRRVPS